MRNLQSGPIRKQHRAARIVYGYWRRKDVKCRKTTLIAGRGVLSPSHVLACKHSVPSKAHVIRVLVIIFNCIHSILAQQQQGTPTFSALFSNSNKAATSCTYRTPRNKQQTVKVDTLTWVLASWRWPYTAAALQVPPRCR